MCTHPGCVKQAQIGNRCLRHQEAKGTLAAQAPTVDARAKAQRIDPPTAPATTPPPGTLASAIEWEDPPKRATVQGRPSTIEPFLQALAQHPGRWAVYTRKAKSHGGGSALTKHAKAAGRKVRRATAQNTDGTWTIWAQIVSEP